MMRALISFFIAIPCAFAQLPGIAPGGIVEAASYSAPIAPGSLVTIFGNNLATSEITATSIPLPAVLGGTSVLVDGVSAPLLYVSPNQINLQLPSSLPFNQAAQVTVVTSSGSSAPAQVQVHLVSPSLFTADGSGCGQLAALNVSSEGAVSLNSPANSAAPGDIVSLYGTGMGVPTPRPPDGLPSNTPIYFTSALSVYFDTLLASTSNYKGVAPGLIGVDQVNVQIPAGAREGCSVPVTIYTYPFLSQRATIAIHSGGGACQDPPIQSYGEISLIKTLLSGAKSQGEIDSLTADFPSGPGITGPPGPPTDSGTTIVANARRCAVAGYKLKSAGIIGIQPVGKPIIYAAPTDMPDGVEYDMQLPMGFIAPGDYAIKAQGETISFDGTVSIGSPIRVQSNLAPGTQINVGSGQPFTIRWSGGDPGSIVKAYIYGGEQYAYKQADGAAGAITFQPVCTGIAHPVCSIGTPPTTNAQVVVEVSPAPDKVAMFQGSGLTGKITATWVYRYVFNNLVLN